MLITIAICTFNRAESLRRTLESLAAMRVPNDLAWELVVVNNNSTDHTDTVIEAFVGRLPIRREFEPQGGLSHARNRAIEAAKGDYIIWTDDDVVVDPGWLAAYAEAFARWPEAAVFGGRIIPRYETPVVEWVANAGAALAGPYAVRDFGDQPMRLTPAGYRLPYGANFAVRGAEQKANRYDPDLGVGPGRNRMADELEVIEAILRSGGTGYWVPEARVDHCIGHERQTLHYITRYFSAAGETDAFRAVRAGTARDLWFGAPRWLWRRFLIGWTTYHICRLVTPTRVWVRYLCTYVYARSAIQFWRGQRSA